MRLGRRGQTVQEGPSRGQTREEGPRRRSAGVAALATAGAGAMLLARLIVGGIISGMIARLGRGGLTLERSHRAGASQY